MDRINRGNQKETSDLESRTGESIRRGVEKAARLMPGLSFTLVKLSLITLVYLFGFLVFMIVRSH